MAANEVSRRIKRCPKINRQPKNTSRQAQCDWMLALCSDYEIGAVEQAKGEVRLDDSLMQRLPAAVAEV